MRGTEEATGSEHICEAAAKPAQLVFFFRFFLIISLCLSRCVSFSMSANVSFSHNHVHGGSLLCGSAEGKVNTMFCFFHCVHVKVATIQQD